MAGHEPVSLAEIAALHARISELTAQNRRLTLESANQATVLRRKDEEIRMLQLRVQQERLTGLMTRDYFEDRVDQIFLSDCSRRLHDPSQVNVFVIIDIDRFKEINDTYGHRAGDKVLATLGKIIRGAIRERDLAARFGGDEFAVFFPEIKSREIAERKIVAIRQTFEHSLSREFGGDNHGAAPKLTFSYGISVVSDELSSFATLYQDADQALYRQKRERRRAAR